MSEAIPPLPREKEEGFDDYPLWLLVGLKQKLFAYKEDPDLTDARAILAEIDELIHKHNKTNLT